MLDVRDSHKMYQKILTTFWCENNVAKNAMKMHLLQALLCDPFFSKNIRAISRKSWPLNHSQKDFVQDNGLLRQCSPSWHQKWWNLFLSKIKLGTLSNTLLVILVVYPSKFSSFEVCFMEKALQINSSLDFHQMSLGSWEMNSPPLRKKFLL